MDKEKVTLRQFLRQDFTKYVRPHFKKSECEVCGSDTEYLHVHHVTHFQDLMYDTLEQLHLEYYDDTDMYTDEELQFIRDIMLGKQMRIDYIICCEPCHRKLHDGSYTKERYRRRKREHKELYYEYTTGKCNEIYDILEQLETICQNDEKHFTGKVGLNEIAERLNLYFKYEKSGKPRVATSVNKINEILADLQIPYEIVKHSCDIKVNGIRIKNYYTVEQK